jgi:hypothetical protein
VTAVVPPGRFTLSLAVAACVIARRGQLDSVQYSQCPSVARNPSIKALLRATVYAWYKSADSAFVRTATVQDLALVLCAEPRVLLCVICAIYLAEGGICAAS